ncbi:hypothetical protein K503DRAFT_769418 [Rhizopogon vinicolor AM-OR11-026]|uniref:Methyltransferase domain-containing protein n=1 Tax=Rhizopogon vinicolor AM-OR11-026 TaxID=1314800 RepID=A0A1B7N3Y5_9AGAM|nr:hypothetical protein K503DRAFT_769418 [Rhizopogon vinicolor AM-OR11-026]
METTTAHDDSKLLLGDINFSIASIPAVDASLYSLTSEEAAFFKTQIGIDDDDELKRHIMEVQAKAYKVAPYPCILGFSFLKWHITTNPVYEHILKLGRERPGAVLLDIGCCFGVDSRKAASNGFPMENIISSDIHHEFLQLGHELFKTTPASYRGHLLPGDVFDPAFIRIAEPSDNVSAAQAIDLSSLKSLNPLHGCISAIYAAKLFHCFTEDKQLHLARALAGLLSAEPGSVICGDQVGALQKGTHSFGRGAKHQVFCHSPQTWSSLWDGEVFQKGSVKVEADLVEVMVFKEPMLLMRWSVTRL